MTDDIKDAEKKAVELPVFYGQKVGMARIFDEKGRHVPVTVIKLISNAISQVKTKERDGHCAYQIAYYQKRKKLINRPIGGHLKKANLPLSYARFAEVRVDEILEEEAVALGQEVSLGLFKEGTFVDVTSTTKGKGFQGVMKRYGFCGGPASHGSHFHRLPGSIGNRMTPGRVFKMKKLPGHMGNKKRTVQNLQVVELNLDKGHLLVRGSVPGGKNGIVRIAKAVKKEKEKERQRV